MMSAKGSSAKKAPVFSDANEVLYDAFQAVQLPDHFPADPPWPEWNDADVNAEQWGNGGKMKSQTTSKGTGKSEMAFDSLLPYYCDPEPGGLPPELEGCVDSWKRPHEVFPQGSLTIYSGTASEGALTTVSEHAANCELFRIISDVCCILRYHAAMEPFPIESETAYFTSNTKGQPWQPWHHIYGYCKAGRDQPHRPVYYPYGKYILRLYYLGAWRKFTVDDQIPCDANGKPLLPVTQVEGELWPIILMKGVLKISSLTPASGVAITDLPVWTLFTGWSIGVIQSHRRTSEQMWRLIHALSPHFALPDDPNSMSVSSKGTTKKPQERRDSKQEEGRPVLTVAELGNFPEDSKLEREFYLVPVLMTRDIPLVRSRTRKATEPWKRIRWVHWASQKGFWTDEKLIPPYRCLYNINFVKELNELIGVDPETESRLFIHEEGADDEASAHGDGPDSPLQWADFYKFFRYLSKVYFLLKPSAMVATYKMTYINLGVNPGTAATTKAKAMPVANEPSTYYMLPTVKMSGNEPPILYCESISGIFLAFSLWVCPREGIDSESYLSKDQPECLAVYHGSLVIEKYDWRSARQSAIVAAVKTVGKGSTCIFLNPGRHALRLWLDTDSPFVIELFSNTEVTVGKGPKIRFVMSTESLYVTEYVTRVSTAFIDLVQKFGKPDHGKNLAVFYNQIKPRNTITVGYSAKMNYFVDAFSSGIVAVLRSIITNEEELRWMVKAVRSLFVDPTIPGCVPKIRSGVSTVFQKKAIKKEPTGTAPMTERRERTFSELMNHEWTCDEIGKVVTIQRMYRGYRVRQLLTYQSPACKDHKVIIEKLKKVCDAMFAPNKREVEVARLIREAISARPDILETFLFHRDISNVTVTEEFTGRITGVEPKAWVPMIRFIFVCHSADPLPCAFYHSCNLEQYTVTVTDNDTNEEIFRLVNSTCPHYYRKNQTGYTLFVYGWNESDPKTVNWRLEMIKMKYFLDIHPCNTTLIGITGNPCHPYQPQPLSMQEIRNFYIPNKQNKICTCLIKVRKRILVTIRLAMSFEDARFYTRIRQQTNGGCSDSESSGDERETVIEAEAKSSAIIFPSVLLDHSQRRWTADSKEEPSDQTVYVLEAFVAHNSWPLTRHEWGVVEPIRVNGESWQESLSAMSVTQSRKSSTGSRRRSIRPSKTGLPSQKVVESPYWYLQVVTDSSPDLSSVLEVTEDRSYQDMIKGMKLSWEENDPGRRHRGKLIQRNFLKNLYDEMLESKKILSYTEMIESRSDNLDAVLREGESVLTVEDGFETLIHEMRSFSYLIQDKSNARYLKSPRILPWVPLDELMAKYSRGKNDSDEMSTIESSRNLQEEDYIIPDLPKGTQEMLEDERKQLLSDMKRQRLTLEEHYLREDSLSRQLLEEVYEERRKVISRMKAVRDKLESKSESQKK